MHKYLCWLVLLERRPLCLANVLVNTVKRVVVVAIAVNKKVAALDPLAVTIALAATSVKSRFWIIRHVRKDIFRRPFGRRLHLRSGFYLYSRTS